MRIGNKALGRQSRGGDVPPCHILTGEEQFSRNAIRNRSEPLIENKCRRTRDWSADSDVRVNDPCGNRCRDR